MRFSQKTDEWSGLVQQWMVNDDDDDIKVILNQIMQIKVALL